MSRLHNGNFIFRTQKRNWDATSSTNVYEVRCGSTCRTSTRSATLLTTRYSSMTCYTIVVGQKHKTLALEYNVIHDQKNSKLLRLCQYASVLSTWYSSTPVPGIPELQYLVLYYRSCCNCDGCGWGSTCVLVHSSVRTDNDTCAGTSTASSTKSILHLELQMSSWRRLELLCTVRSLSFPVRRSLHGPPSRAWDLHPSTVW